MNVALHRFISSTNGRSYPLFQRFNSLKSHVAGTTLQSTRYIRPVFPSAPRISCRSISSIPRIELPQRRPRGLYSPPYSQSIRRGPLTKPIEMDKDVPVLVHKPGEEKPVLFLPREPHPWWKIWSIPEDIPLTRRSIVSMFWIYLMVGAVVQIVMSAPRRWRDWKEAEKLHITLRKILDQEQLYLDSLYLQMTLNEIHFALEPLPLKPGTEYDEDEEEREIVRQRVRYPD